MIKLRTFILFVLLSVLIGITACREERSPSKLAVLTKQAPSAKSAVVTDQATTTLVKTSLQPTEIIATPTKQPGYFSREYLIEDARQLAEILESTHPDPYIRGGGKIAFHRRLQQLLNAIPEGGMTRDEFVHLLRPFIAAVGDGHTRIRYDYRLNDSYPGGVPLRFDIIERSLYVSGVPDEEDIDLIGALLVSVEGVPIAELCKRQERLEGTENLYHTLQLLARFSLWYEQFMGDLLPEWEDTHHVSVELQLPSGEVEEMSFSLPKPMGFLYKPESQVTLPKTDLSGFLYNFVDAKRTIAYLRVEHMLHFREAYEIWAAAGSRHTTEKERDGIKSATETFRDLVVEMKEAGTETLIVDLRDNDGGHSLMADILLYFLYDKESFLAVKTYTPASGGGEIRRYSELYFRSCSKLSIEDFNENRAVPLLEGDYNFDDDFTDNEEKVHQLFQGSEIPAFLERWLNRSSTFFAEFETGSYAGFYCPERILVLVNPGTFGSGFTMARHLYLAGATLVGTPSAQASNCFGEIIRWRLKHTGIAGLVSGSYFNKFPNDSELGRVLPLHYPVTYETLASYDFDPNAEYLYTLEYLSGNEE